MHQNKHFRYYEFGPKRADPLICLGGAASTADCFYKQVLALSSKVGTTATTAALWKARFKNTAPFSGYLAAPLCTSSSGLIRRRSSVSDLQGPILYLTIMFELFANLSYMLSGDQPQSEALGCLGAF